MKKKTIILGALLVGFVNGCTNDSENDLVPVDDDSPDGVVTYNADIKAIIDANCTGCHSDPPVNGAPFPLTTFVQVRARAENGSLSNVVGRQTGEAGAMPPGGRLPQSIIDRIDQWIDDGLLEE